jgi:hypothetical protein
MRSPTPQLRALILGLSGAAGLVLAALAAGAPRLSNGGKLLDSFPGIGKSVQPIVNKLTKLNGSLGQKTGPVPTRPPPSTTWANAVELAVLALVVLGIVWYVIVPAMRDVNWSALRLPPELAEDELEEALVTPEAAERLSEDLARMIDVLDEDADARQAVLGCWLALEAAIGRSGAARRPAESSSELTTRVLAAYDVDGQALETLHRLYRAARFSMAPVDDDARRAARAVLGELRVAIESSGSAPSPSESALAGRAP